jgi:RNA polymerase sigma factor (sigma-70 family)
MNTRATIRHARFYTRHMATPKENPSQLPSGARSRKSRGTGPDLTALNRDLFTKRAVIEARLSELESVTSEAELQAHAKQLKRARMELDDILRQIHDANIGLVKAYANMFAGVITKEQREDYEQAGFAGLVDAISKFRPELGNSFASLASSAIKREVLKMVRENEHSNISARDFESRPKVMKALRDLSGPDGMSTPSVEQVAAKAGVSVEQSRRVLEARPIESLDTPLGYEKFASRMNQESKEVFPELDEDRILLDHLENATQDLTIEELYIFTRDRGLDGWATESEKDIANALGKDRGTVHRAKLRAAKKVEDRGYPHIGPLD